MKKIVIVGAGIGGLPTAYELRDKLGKEHEITVLSDSPTFQFVPSNPWIAVNWRKRSDICIDIEKPLTKKGIHFNASGLKKLDPANRMLAYYISRLAGVTRTVALQYGGVIIAIDRQNENNAK